MNTPQSLESTDALPPLSEEQVAEYLRDNPDFFDHHEALLATLALSHPSGEAVSLIERQISVLREENRHYKHKLKELVEAGHNNDRVNRTLHELTLDLMRAENIDHAVRALVDSLRTGFKADAVTLHLVATNELRDCPPEIQTLDRDDPALKTFEPLLQSTRPFCGRLKASQLGYLFGEDANRIESAAVIPIGQQAELGVLAIGSDDADRFHPGMDTLFLKHLGELFGCELSDYSRSDG